MILNNGKLILTISIALSTIFIYLFLKMRKKKIISWEAFTYSGYLFFLVIIIYVFYTLSYNSIMNNYPNRKFTKKEWLSNVEKRYELYKDLSENKKDLLLHKTENEIINQLRLLLFTNDSTAFYYLGITPSLFAIDPELLVVQFDENKICFNFFTKRQS